MYSFADFDSESQVLSPKVHVCSSWYICVVISLHCALQVVEVKNDDSAFFERAGHEAELETIKRPERRVSESLMVRLCHIQ